MKKMSIKVISSIALAAMLISTVPVQIFALDSVDLMEVTADKLSVAESGIMPATVNVYKDYEIDKIKSRYTESEGSWKLLFDGSNTPCKRDGETVTAGSSVTYSHAVTGTLHFPLKKKIEASVGYTIGKDETFLAQKTSAPLKKGEYVKAYYKKMYEVTPVVQKVTTTTTGYETVNGVTRPVNKVEVERTEVKCKKAIMPDIDLRYYSKNSTRANEGDSLVARETYEFRDGKYVLTDKETY